MAFQINISYLICRTSTIFLYVKGKKMPMCCECFIFSSPEPKGELKVYPCSGVRRCCCRCRRPPFSNDFSSETAWPIKAKFYVEPPWKEGTKVCINGPGLMTKMTVMPIYG